MMTNTVQPHIHAALVLNDKPITACVETEEISDISTYLKSKSIYSITKPLTHRGPASRTCASVVWAALVHRKLLPEPMTNFVNCQLHPYQRKIFRKYWMNMLSSKCQPSCSGPRDHFVCLRPANERWRYIVTASLIGWPHKQMIP